MSDTDAWQEANGRELGAALAALAATTRELHSTAAG